MLEAAVIAARWLQYAGAAILFGSSLFFVYAGPAARGRALVATGAAVLTLTSLAAIAAQASLFAGSFADGLTSASLGAVATTMDLGKAALARACIAALALVLVLRPRWPLVATLGALAAASLAWLGHGGADEGHPLHLVTDIVHVLAACAWLGALPAFLLMSGCADFHHQLARFAGIGSLLVALLVLTGLLNALFLIGLAHVLDVWATPYGQALAVKLALFAAMLALAANNRWRLTPALANRPGPEAVAALRHSIGFEMLAGAAVLGAVAWLGTLPPPAG